MGSEVIIREVLAEHEGKRRGDVKYSKFRWPEAVWGEKEILLWDWTPAETLLTLKYLFSKVQRSPPSPSPPGTLPLFRDRSERDLSHAAWVQWGSRNQHTQNGIWALAFGLSSSSLDIFHKEIIIWIYVKM